MRGDLLGMLAYAVMQAEKPHGMPGRSVVWLSPSLQKPQGREADDVTLSPRLRA